MLPSVLRRTVRQAVLKRRPWAIYGTPVTSLAPERLYWYLHTLWQTRAVEGAVVEIGCWLGGTSALASGFLQRTGHGKRYVAIDTFAGFVPEQFDRDPAPEGYRSTFNGSSLEMVRALLDHW